MKKQWYDNIPKNGVWCWVGDRYEDDSLIKQNGVIAIITGYGDSPFPHFYNKSGSLWGKAIPLTDEEKP